MQKFFARQIRFASFKRLIKTAIAVALLLLPVLALRSGDCQTRRLPKATFPSYAQSLPASPGSLYGGSGSSMYNSQPAYGSPSMPSSISSTPGVHLTSGYDRTRANAAQPYSPGEPSLNMALVRWQRQKMPLRIWISPGLQLPSVPFDQLQQTRVEMVYNMLQQEAPFSGLPTAKGWTEDTNYKVAAGIEQWRQFENEGLLSFGFTTDPKTAQIFVFFCDHFEGTQGPGGINVGGNTCAQVFTFEQLQLPNYRQKPVVIELSTQINHTLERMQGAAAHEFGHALGIKAHSPFRDDIMYADRVVDALSEGDKSTIRLLYRTEPKYVM